MKLMIMAVGRMKAGTEQTLYDKYADRISKSGKALHLTGPDLVEIVESRSEKPDKRKENEAEALIASAGKDVRIIMLDEKGKDLSSREFADLIKNEQDAGTQTLAFAIGGPDGHGELLKSISVRKIRFGSMTWPHQMARILLAEQLYRAITIFSGHPYHRD